MGEGEAEAAGLYAKAYGADLPFYSFYKSFFVCPAWWQIFWLLLNALFGFKLFNLKQI